jgi:hypothetical protein
MGRTAHCPSRKQSLRSLPLGDANRGVLDVSRGANRRSPPHRPPERRAFPSSDVPGRRCSAGRSPAPQAPLTPPQERRRGRFLAQLRPAPYNLTAQ